MVSEIIDIVDTTIDLDSANTPSPSAEPMPDAMHEDTPLPAIEESDLDDDDESSVAAAAHVLLKAKSPELGGSSPAKIAVELATVTTTITATGYEDDEVYEDGILGPNAERTLTPDKEREDGKEETLVDA